MAHHQSLFDDRGEAGRQLAEAIDAEEMPDPVLVALSNDGIPVAFEMARRLGLPLDLLIIQAVAAPGDPHQSIGMIVDGSVPHMIIDESAALRLRPPPGYLDSERHHQLAEIERRHRMFFGEDEPADHDHMGRNVILVDDGSAPAPALLAAVHALRMMRVGSIRIALPVAAPDILAALQGEVDAIVCLATGRHLAGSGSVFAASEATSDQVAVRLLREARKLGRMIH